jgi:hypothetical protein
MATYTGKDGIAKIGSNAVAEVRSFSVEETAETVDDTVMGDQWRTKKATLKSWSGSLECFWDPDDTNGQVALAVGSEVTLSLYPEGDESGGIYLTGTAIITGHPVNASLEGLVEASFNFEGSGPLTKETVGA